jgi:hypothetical protein
MTGSVVTGAGDKDGLVAGVGVVFAGSSFVAEGLGVGLGAVGAAIGFFVGVGVTLGVGTNTPLFHLRSPPTF